jgi:hypothetical protein
MMSAVTVPPGRGFIWRAGKYGTSQLHRFKHAPGMSASRLQLLTYRAAQRSARFGPKPGIASFNSIDYGDRLIVASLF